MQQLFVKNHPLNTETIIFDKHVFQSGRLLFSFLSLRIYNWKQHDTEPKQHFSFV